MGSASATLEGSIGAATAARLPSGWTVVEDVRIDGHRYVVARLPAAPEGLFERLTRREAEVIELLLRGRAPKQIAYALGCAHATVRVLLSRAYRRLGVSGRRGLLTAVERRAEPTVDSDLATTSVATPNLLISTVRRPPA